MVDRLDKSRLPYLDGIRGIAILAVFLFHSLKPSFGFFRLEWSGLFPDFNAPISYLLLFPITYGSAGVAIFFVVSGFCIHLSHSRNQNGWLSFANKRLFRIYPPYLLAIFVFFFIWPWGTFGSYDTARIVQLVSHVLAIHNYDQNTFLGINPSFWSIAIEIQLYAIYPLLLFITSKLGWSRGMIIVGCIELFIRLAPAIPILDMPARFLIASPFAYWLSWSLGAYLCQCLIERRTSPLFRIHFGLMSAVAFMLPLFKPLEPYTFTAFSMLTAIVIERLMTAKWALPKHRQFKRLWAHLSFLGLTSYSFYLFHQPLLDESGRVLEWILPGATLHPLIKYSVCLTCYPAILALSYFLYRLIEKPSIQFGKYVRHKLTIHKTNQPIT